MKINVLNLVLAGAYLQDHGVDLCLTSVDHLLSDSGCTPPRKAGGINEHTSVNGGQFNYAHGDGTKAEDAQQPSFDPSGACTNWVFQMFMEASNSVDKDGSTAVPEDKSP